jgi:hypothetical protein
MKDKDIKLTAGHPETDVKHIVRGIVRQGLKPVPPKASIYYADLPLGRQREGNQVIARLLMSV